ncbi:microfibril-associated glycoprotein 4-like isoform X2 [Garra rufa]
MFVVALLSVFMGFTESVSDEFKPVDCSDIYNSGETVSGIHSIYPAGDDPVWVDCEMISDGNDEDNGGWTVIQRRMDGSIDFYLPWSKFKKGFGTVLGEYWLGLGIMYQMTRNRKYMLRVDPEDFAGKKGFAMHSSFSLVPEAGGYKLQVSGFKDGGAGDSMTFHSAKKFITLDKDQDLNGTNCAKPFLGAFWYNACQYAYPIGVHLWDKKPTDYPSGDVWYTWTNSHAVGIKKSISMKIKPAP